MNETFEIWKTIPGYEAVYSVSNMGKVRRDCMGKRLQAGQMVKQWNNTYGYPSVRLRRESKGHSIAVHRIVSTCFLGPRPEGLVVNHIDGNKLNNRVENLEYVTPKENVHHAIKNGLSRVLYGEEVGTSKLHAQEVLDIKGKYASGAYSQRNLAKEYSVSQTCIRMISKNRIWRHLTDESISSSKITTGKS